MSVSSVNPPHPFAIVSLFSQGLSQRTPLTGSQTTIRASLLSLEKGFYAFDWGVFVWSLFRLSRWFFALLVCRTSANKTLGRAELCRTGRTFHRSWGRGHDVWCVSSVKLLFTPRRMRTKTFCRISLSLNTCSLMTRRGVGANEKLLLS